MKRWIFLPLLAVGVAAAVQYPATWDAEATKTYTDRDGLQIVQEGACSYDEHHISCWNAVGQPSEELTSMVLKFYMGNPGMQMFYGFHQKNRLIVFSRVGGTSDVGEYQLSGVSQPVARIFQTPAGKVYSAAPLMSPSDAKVASLIVSLPSIPLGTIATVPFFKGSHTTYQGSEIEIGATKPGAPGGFPMSGPVTYDDPSRGPAPKPEKQWTYYVQIDPPVTGNVSVFFAPVDKLGKDISLVDPEGRPIAASPPVPDPKIKIAAAQMSLQSMNNTVAVIASNVNPADVGSLKLIGSHERRILFKDVLLDPK